MKKTVPLGIIVLTFTAFISLGLPDGLLGVAWPGIRTHFQLGVDAIGLLLIGGTLGYILSSFFSGSLVRWLGLGGLLSASCGLTSAALLVYAFSPIWLLFPLAAFLGGFGAGAIDAGLNTYVAQNHSERTMQWLHASFGIGITSGPIIMTLGIAFSSYWQLGYILVGIAQSLLALVFFIRRDAWITRDEEYSPGTELKLTQTLKQIPALLSMLIFFIYTGVELGFGLWSYTLLTESRSVAPEIAGFITGSYWAMFTLGRILAGWYTKKVRPVSLLYISMFAALTGKLLFLLDINTTISVIGIAILGFAVAPIFPALVSDTVSRVGKKHEANTIGMQVAAAGLGAALVPSFAGFLAGRLGLEIIPIYMFIAIWLLIGSFYASHRFKTAQ
jgi:fucose permease